MLRPRNMTTESLLEGALREEESSARPLCVSLDGTLVTTNTLWEGLVLLFRQRPWVSLAVPLWFSRGSARFKAKVAQSGKLDPKTLPYRAELVSALKASRQSGRKIVLATSAHRALAESVAEHLALFDAVYASDESANLKGARKRDALNAAFSSGFDYVGDSAADAPMFASATRGYLVGAAGKAVSATRGMQQVRVVSRRPSVLRALIKELRAH